LVALGDGQDAVTLRRPGMLLASPNALARHPTLANGPDLDPDPHQSSTRHFFRELNRFRITSDIDAAGGFRNTRTITSPRSHHGRQKEQRCSLLP
jgi:hypothetical protein